LNFLKKQDKENSYKEQFSVINNFLKVTRKQIFTNNMVPKGVKLLALGMSFNPNRSISLYHFLGGKALVSG
jgi:hypothetical protein